MYRIIAYNPDGSSYTIYDPAGTGALPVLAPRTTEELNEAGSLEFALIVDHAAYGNLLPKATYFSAELDGEEFFYGRLLTPEESPLLGQIQYTCSGALSLLQDSELPADGKKEDGTMDSQTMTAEAFLRRCIENHNADIGNDPRRTFTVGIVNHPDKGKEREYQISSYVDTLSAIKQNIIEWYGGFLRVRSDGNGGHLIDWVSQYGDTDAGTLDLGENILSLTHRINTDDLVTAIRPVGKDGLLLTVPTIDLFPAADMQKYGKIVKSVTFSDCKTEADLQAKADEFVARIHNTYRISSEIKLVDMHFVDGLDHGVNLGDVFTNIYGMEGTSLIVGNRGRDFENPQNDSISLKSPREYEGDTSGGSYSNRKESDTITDRTSKNTTSAGYAYKYIHEFQDRLELNTKEIAINAETLELHGDRIIETANNYTRLSHKADTLEDKVGTIEGTGVIQNSEHITSLAGKFQLNTETNEVELISGTEFVVHERNGATITVGNRLSSVTSEVNSLGQRISVFEGSALWTQRDNITGVVGEFDVVTAQDGTKTLRIRSGGGIKVLRDNVEFGLYDSGNLTAGVIVDKINGGTTKIRGTNVIIEGNTTIADVMAISGNYVSIKRPMIISGNGSSTIISGTDVSADNVAIRSALVFGSEGSSDRRITYSTLSTMIKEASKSGNTLTLTRFDGTTLDFSGATTLTGAWDSGTYTVTASPQGSTRETTLQLITPVPNSTISRSNKYVSRQFKVLYGPNEDSLNDTGFMQTITIDASSVYNYGKSEVTLMDPTWNSISGAVPSSRTATVSTSGRVNDIGTTDNLSKSITVEVSVDSSYAYVKHGSTTVAQIAHNYKYTQDQLDSAVSAATIAATTSGYNNGWKDSYNGIGLNYSSDQELSYDAPSVTIYPTGKATPSADAASIVSKGITVRAPYVDSNWTASTINRNAPDGYTKVVSGGQVYYTDNSTSGASKGVRIYIAPKITVDGHEFNSNYAHQVYFSSLPTRIWADAYAAGAAAATVVVTAGTSAITWDSTNKKFYNYGYAYVNGGSQPEATSAKRESSVVSLDTSASWSNGSKSIVVKHGSASILSDSVAIPASSATTWENPTGHQWRSRLTIGGVYRYSGNHEFYTLSEYNAALATVPSGYIKAPAYIKTDGNRWGDWYTCRLYDSNGNAITTIAGGPNSGAYIPMSEGQTLGNGSYAYSPGGFGQNILGWRSFTVQGSSSAVSVTGIGWLSSAPSSWDGSISKSAANNYVGMRIQTNHGNIDIRFLA